MKSLVLTGFLIGDNHMVLQFHFVCDKLLISFILIINVLLFRIFFAVGRPQIYYTKKEFLFLPHRHGLFRTTYLVHGFRYTKSSMILTHTAFSFLFLLQLLARYKNYAVSSGFFLGVTQTVYAVSPRIPSCCLWLLLL